MEPSKIVQGRIFLIWMLGKLPFTVCKGKGHPSVYNLLIPVEVALGGVLEHEQSEEGVEWRDCDGWARVLRLGG